MNWTLLDEQWQQRHDPAVFSELETALDSALWNSKGTPEYPLLWRWARLSHFRAMQSLEKNGSSEAARLHFEAAAQEAETACEVQPNLVEGHFWFGVCHIEAARTRGKLAAARALSKASAHIDRAANIDEAYHFAGPLRVQARFTHLRPLLLGGSLDRSLDIYRRALQIAPHNSTTLLYYAEALIADQDWKPTRRTLHQIINAPPDKCWIWEQTRDRRLATELLASLDAR
jgi:tetratricopeptide (TPR) repeat protein